MSPESFQKFNRMNHDLRTHLTVISAGIHLICQDNETADKHKEMLKRISRAIDKADSVLDLTWDELRKENE